MVLQFSVREPDVSKVHITIFSVEVVNQEISGSRRKDELGLVFGGEYGGEIFPSETSGRLRTTLNHIRQNCTLQGHHRGNLRSCNDTEDSLKLETVDYFVGPENLCFSLDVVGVIKSRKIRGAQHVAHVTNGRSGFKVLIRKASRKL
jgi:hypothetical protein